MTFRNSEQAFKDAIKAGRLSLSRTQPNWAGNYMYMGTDESGHDLFKNINTRLYDV